LLREELKEAKSDAHSALLAANKMSKILDQLKQLKSEEIDKKRMEYDHIKVEEAWVSFFYQVLESNLNQIRKLREDFYLVVRVEQSIGTSEFEPDSLEQGRDNDLLDQLT